MNLNLLAILPEALLVLLAVAILILDPLFKADSRRVNLGWLAAGGLTLILLISFLAGQPAQNELTLGGMVRFDWFAFAFKMFFIFAAAITALLMMDVDALANRAEAYVLLLAATIGMNLMAASADLVMLYLAIETTSIPLYVLAGFLTDNDKSTEAGFKYLLFGAMTSAILLYGFSLLFGFAGTTNLAAMAVSLATPTVFSLGALLLVLVGFGFKTSIVPFHFWAPDVYEGASTPIAGFLSTASKAAGFAVLLRFSLTVFPQTGSQWQYTLAVISILTMTIGNLVALAQKNIKRMLAYSSIAHAGYALIGVVAASTLGTASAVFYMMAYILTNLAAFAIVTVAGRVIGSDDLRAYDGLSRRSPYLALAMLVAFLSLAGMPPFGGFVAKLLVFAAGVEKGWIGLVIAGIINSIIGVYYYLTTLKYVYLYRMEGEDEESYPIPVSRPYAIALTVLVAGVILLGTFFAPWYDLTVKAAASLF
ncbi:MAG: NADH-quinone oxidoreductase subunit N [Anaerolineae bacterium CG_4_9_14_3_um_filter_57_17]|nr:NADH-quinone oxidoreductase subunit N [bacterium]NCT20052.1 NADH-quinone oxidoreductase subunit N [bacterium]OIO83207.1 MAG: hypothetical protein AUK01_13220 [Anaerolineae bacterium CG2_30_57_67]PJB65189.1 MAG: NADH-quinone oxidoreductase subunit N [Anaerolineae bacterium CG_4_9_14_3_um_filter_57_17]